MVPAATSHPFPLCIPQIQGEVTGEEALTEAVAEAEAGQAAAEEI